ncbi:ribosomal protein 63, mitochondrial [Chrysoperla carnea]|uniref:ribosomal protein 63, mitochondrial n=1 Tax=Chrysoperla carnea TaxID=189513 RepID=UPI001D088A9E|nr:ribosomal protein 63, mitochondrial [Chrysoperla carnea]
MRLTLALLRKKMPNGHIYRGKYRIVPPTTGKHIAQKRIDYEIEEKNMLYLRHPFLTPEQSFGHAKALGKSEQRMERLKAARLEDYFKKPHVRLEDRLAHLRVTDSWE